MTLDYAGLIISSIVSLVTGILISRHFSHRKRLSWAEAQRRVLDPAGGNFPEDVEVRFDGSPVDRLSEWTIGLWNSGNQPIVESDILEEKKLILCIPGHRILKLTKPTESRSTIHAEVDINSPDKIHIGISALDRGDGFVFTVYTDLLTEESCPVENLNIDEPYLSGHIIGMPAGPRKKSVPDSFGWPIVIFLLLAAVFYAALAAFFLMGSYELLTTPRDTEVFSWLSRNIRSQAVGRTAEIGLGVSSAALGVVFVFATMMAVALPIIQRFTPIPRIVRREFDRLYRSRSPIRGMIIGRFNRFP